MATAAAVGLKAVKGLGVAAVLSWEVVRDGGLLAVRGVQRWEGSSNGSGSRRRGFRTLAVS